jgi:hypothetical protein
MNPTIVYQFERAAFLVGVVVVGGALGAAIPPASRGLERMIEKLIDYDIARERAKIAKERKRNGVAPRLG